MEINEIISVRVNPSKQPNQKIAFPDRKFPTTAESDIISRKFFSML